MQSHRDTDFLDWALADCAGYVAADELYDGPFCMLSAVDNRCDKRILSEVVDHDPNHDDLRAFLGRLQTALEARDLTLRGMTTDGSSLYAIVSKLPLYDHLETWQEWLPEYRQLIIEVQAIYEEHTAQGTCSG